MKRQWLPLIGFCAAVAGPIFLSSTAQGASEAPKTGGTLSIALNSDVRSLEPGVNRDANTDTVVYHMFEGLVGYRRDLSVGPALAESWRISDDGKTYTFKLRRGIHFQDGSVMKASDVKWSWDRLNSHKDWACHRLFDGSAGLKVVDVAVPDDDTVVYKLNEPNATFLAQLANIQCGIYVESPHSVDKDGKWKTPIGTGPFKLKEWKHGESLTLERFKGYTPSLAPTSGLAGKRTAYVDQIQFRVIPDADAALAALQTGAVDIVPEVDPMRVTQLRKQGVNVVTAPGLGWTALLLQTKDPLLSNPTIRLALAHAIDINQIAAARTNGLAKGNPSGVADASQFFDPAFDQWPAYDPAKAQALLKQAGYHGQPVIIQTNKRYPGMYDNAILVQAMLSAAGVNAQLQVLDWATQLNNYLSGKFQIQSFGYSPRFDPSLMYATFIGDKSKSAWAQWDDPEAVKLLAESSSTTDSAKRKAVFLQMHQLMEKDVPIIGLYYDPTVEAIGPHVHGYQPWAASRPIGWGAWKDDAQG